QRRAGPCQVRTEPRFANEARLNCSEKEVSKDQDERRGRSLPISLRPAPQHIGGGGWLISPAELVVRRLLAQTTPSSCLKIALPCSNNTVLLLKNSAPLLKQHRPLA